jgi:hypothetical protein
VRHQIRPEFLWNPSIDKSQARSFLAGQGTGTDIIIGVNSHESSAFDRRTLVRNALCGIPIGSGVDVGEYDSGTFVDN